MSIDFHQMQQPQQSSMVEWAVARRSVRTLERESGQISVVRSTPSGFLIALICGLRERQEGLKAARAVAEVFESFTHQPLSELFSRADRASKDTGGCSVAAAVFNTSYHTVSWLGVGSIQGFLHHRSEVADPKFHWLKPQAGYVGDNIFSVKEVTMPIRMGDNLILATDTIFPEFADELPIEGKPRVVADTLLGKHSRTDDDSLMLVTRYLGGM